MVQYQNIHLLEETVDHLEDTEKVFFEGKEYRNAHEFRVEMELETYSKYFFLKHPIDKFISFILLAFFFGVAGRIAKVSRQILAIPSLQMDYSLILSFIWGGFRGLVILGPFVVLMTFFPEWPAIQILRFYSSFA